MSIPTHTELATSQEKLLNNRMLYSNEWEDKCKTHPRKFLPSIKGNTKWKTTTLREKKLTWSMEDKDSRDPRVWRAGRQGLSHIMRDQQKPGVTGRWKGQIHLRALLLLGHNYSVLWRSFTIAATLETFILAILKAAALDFLHPPITSWKMQPLLRSNSDGREGQPHNLWHGHMVRKAHGWFASVSSALLVTPHCHISLPWGFWGDMKSWSQTGNQKTPERPSVGFKGFSHLTRRFMAGILFSLESAVPDCILIWRFLSVVIPQWEAQCLTF